MTAFTLPARQLIFSDRTMIAKTIFAPYPTRRQALTDPPEVSKA